MLSCYDDDDDDDDHRDDDGGGGGSGGHHRAQPIDVPVLLRARTPRPCSSRSVPFHSHPNDLPSSCVLHPGSRRACSLLPSFFISSTYVFALFYSILRPMHSFMFSTSSSFLIFTSFTVFRRFFFQEEFRIMSLFHAFKLPFVSTCIIFISSLNMCYYIFDFFIIPSCFYINIGYKRIVFLPACVSHFVLCTFFMSLGIASTSFKKAHFFDSEVVLRSQEPFFDFSQQIKIDVFHRMWAFFFPVLFYTCFPILFLLRTSI